MSKNGKQKRQSKKSVKRHPWIGKTIRIKTCGRVQEFAIKKVGREMVRAHNGVNGLNLPKIQVELHLAQM